MTQNNFGKKQSLGGHENTLRSTLSNLSQTQRQQSQENFNKQPVKPMINHKNNLYAKKIQSDLASSLKNVAKVKFDIQFFFSSIEHKFKRFFFQRDILKCVNCVAQIIFLGVEFNSFETIYNSMFFLASVIECFGQFDLCFGIYQQIIQSADLSNHRMMRVKSLIKIAQLCHKNKIYEQSLKLLMKSLEHCWMCNEKSLATELKIYDMLGYSFYLVGDITKARYFHQKTINGILEENDLLAKKTCIEHLREVEEFENSGTKIKRGYIQEVNYNLIHTLGLKQEFIQRVNHLTEGNKMVEHRLFAYKDYHRPTEEKEFMRKLLNCELKSIKENFSDLEEPLLNMYKSDDFEKTMNEFLSLSSNKVLYEPPDSVNKTQISNFDQRVKVYSTLQGKGSKYQNNLFDYLNPSNKHKMNQKELNSVTFYSRKMDTSQFVTPVDHMTFTSNNSKQRSFYPHLSPNRCLSEFRPYFEPNINIESFFQKMQKQVFEIVDKVLKSQFNVEKEYNQIS